MTGQNTEYSAFTRGAVFAAAACASSVPGAGGGWRGSVALFCAGYDGYDGYSRPSRAYLGHSLYTAPPPTTSEYALYDTILWKLVAISLSLVSIIRWGHMARSCPGLASGTQCCGRILRTHQKLVVKKGKNAECPRRMWLGCLELSC